MKGKEGMQWGKRYHFNFVYEPPLPYSMVRLRQVGEIIVGDGYVIPEHMQPCVEISYVVSGECDFYVEDQVIHAKEGDVHVIEPGKRHMIVSGENNNLRMAYIGFYFHENEKRNEWSTLKKFYLNPPIQLRNEKKRIKALFEQLLMEIYLSEEYCREAIDACITQILVQVYRVFKGEELRIKQYDVDESRMNHVVGHTVFQALRYIDNNIACIDNISQVAKALKYNPAYLSRVFGEKMGVTMSDYIANKKVEEAKGLLIKGVSISEIAYRLGYSSSQSFSKMFRRHVGNSPGEYKKNIERKDGVYEKEERI